MPDELVDAVGEEVVGHQLEVGHLLLAHVVARPAVEAREGLRAHDVAAGDGGGRGGDPREGRLEEHRLRLGDVDGAVGVEQVDGRARYLRPAEVAAGVGYRVEVAVEAQDSLAEQGVVVVALALAARGVERVHTGLDAVAVGFGESRPEVTGPEPPRLDLPAVDEQRLRAGGRERRGEAVERAREVAEVVRGREVVDHEPGGGPLPVRGDLLAPGGVRTAGGGAVALRGLGPRDVRVAEGPERAAGEVAAQSLAGGVALGEVDGAAPVRTEPGRPRDRRGVPRGGHTAVGVDEGQLDAAEAVGAQPVEVGGDGVGVQRRGEEPVAGQGAGVRRRGVCRPGAVVDGSAAHGEDGEEGRDRAPPHVARKACSTRLPTSPLFSAWNCVP